MEWADRHQGRIPQIIVNREPPSMDYVSTDHAGAVYEITRERLDAHPGWRPVFLDAAGNPSPAVVALRREGFIRACREHDVFYDPIALPEDYGDRLAMLRSRLDSAVGTPLLVVSASLQHTGTVVAWARESDRRWREDLLYSDFDNDYGAHVWGVTVTSLLQDYSRLRTAAVQGLVELIQGKVRRVQLLQPALRRDGET
jgi:DNA-binding LacI/PurR family transcriptional regulator